MVGQRHWGMLQACFANISAVRTVFLKQETLKGWVSSSSSYDTAHLMARLANRTNGQRASTLNMCKCRVDHRRVALEGNDRTVLTGKEEICLTIDDDSHRVQTRA